MGTGTDISDEDELEILKDIVEENKIKQDKIQDYNSVD